MRSQADRHSPDVQPGRKARIQNGLHTVLSDLFETGENDELFLLTGIADVLQLSESDGLRKLEWKKRRRPAAGDAGQGLRMQKRRSGADGVWL